MPRSLEIAIRLFFVVFGQYKIFGSGFVHSGFRDYVQGFIRDGAYPLWCPFSGEFWPTQPMPWALAVMVKFLIGGSLRCDHFSLSSHADLSINSSTRIQKNFGHPERKPNL